MTLGGDSLASVRPRPSDVLMDALIFPLLIVGFLYFFMIAPQRRKMKAHRQLLSSLNEGDEVLTNAGIYGAVAEVEDSVIWLEVAPEVELKVQKASIAQVVSQVGDSADDDADAADDTDGSN
ncbi:MAG: preprotein translocase subunit YajC [Acidimicrobiaceae bacterium]|nr:preprotein translocase subunit YajC [Acidimicrobiaceae bacterium]MYC43354.1 preprotein translocase subunit YajC [Acidimicrobiaceae bacterium]